MKPVEQRIISWPCREYNPGHIAVAILTAVLKYKYVKHFEIT
jgi:hypothetical protein